MTLKPMTYLISFTLFVVLFMGLGGYVGYRKIADHFLVQSFLDATSINVHVLDDQQGKVLRWEDKVVLKSGVFASILASNRLMPISINYSDETSLSRPSSEVNGILLAANERVEDIRIDTVSHYLYARVFATAKMKSQEITWLYRFDLQSRHLSRRIAVNPITLPATFKP